MSNEQNVSKFNDSTRDHGNSNAFGTAWNLDLAKPEDSKIANQGCTRLPKEFDSPIEFYDSKQENSGGTESERLKQALECLLLMQLDSKSFSELMKPIEKSILDLLERRNPHEEPRCDDNKNDSKNDNKNDDKNDNKNNDKNDDKNDSKNDTKDNTKDDTKDNTKDNTKNNTKDNTNNDNAKDNSKDNTKDNSKDNAKDNSKDNTTDDTKNGPKDNTDGKSDRVVHVKDGHELETLKIEKGMTVKLEPGGNYKIHKGLQLPEGASIVGDKNNPATIDFVGPTVSDKGRNFWPACITVNGPNATVDGLKLECSGMKMYENGGANGILANENADNLTVKNSTAGKINTFVHLNGADNVTVDNCNVPAVNSYFVWNEYDSNNNTIKNSRCDDSYKEWTIRSYGDNLTVEDSQIGNKNPPQGPFKGALALYNGSAKVEDCIVDGGVRIGPLNAAIHGLQYIDPEHPDRLRSDLTADEKKKAEILHDSIDVRMSGNKITGWVSLNQNSNSYFEDNDINRPTAANGSWVAFTETKREYAGFREPAKGVFVNNRFSGPVEKPLYNPWKTPVRLAEGNTFNGKEV